MKYHFHILIFSVFFISLFGFNEAFAAGSLSFDQDRMVINHSTIIYCYDCGGGNSINVDVDSDSDSISVTLHKISGTSDYASDWVKFCDSNCSGPNVLVTAPGETVIASKGGVDDATATVFGSNTWDPAEYAVGVKAITPYSGGVCDASNGWDRDGDGICNYWEKKDQFMQIWPDECPSDGLCIWTSLDAKPYFQACVPGSTHWSNACPSWSKADVYYEIDYMLGHKPSDATISAVADAFANSNFVAKNNNGKIQFHAQLDEELPHVDSIPWGEDGHSGNPGYDQLKYWWYGTASERTYSLPDAEDPTSDWLTTPCPTNPPSCSERSMKAQVVRYAIFGHNISGAGIDPDTSGLAERPGNDVIVSLGSFDGMVGSSDQQQGTLLHEIGHNLNLQHGGNGGKNCKPNYISVMSYALQFPIYAKDRALDLSRLANPTLDEDLLNEPAGIPTTNYVREFAYGPPPNVESSITGVPVDWDRDGDPDDNPANGSIDINNLGITDCMASPGDEIIGFQDWSKYSLRLSPLGIATSGEEGTEFDPNSSSPDGFLKNVFLREINYNDVITMHVQRIDAILSKLDKVPDDDFMGNAAEVRTSYKKDLEQVKTLIRANVGGNNTMPESYKKLDQLYLKLDGLGDDDIIKSDSRSIEGVKDLVEDVIIAQSHSLGGAKDFLNLGREINNRTSVIPSPNSPEPYFSYTPYNQTKYLTGEVKVSEDKVIDFFVCKDGLELAIKESTGKYICLTPESKETMICQEIALPAPYDRDQEEKFAACDTDNDGTLNGDDIDLRDPCVPDATVAACNN